jgi:hypothetical protein
MVGRIGCVCKYSVFCRTAVRYRGARTHDDVGLSSRLLHKVCVVQSTVDELGIRVSLFDRLSTLFVPDEEGEVPVWVRLCDIRVGSATDVA